ncbi:non-ribosomal peptide synthase protein (TIGR01720 family)/amino acid adenylation domain-containing protein [Chitinophaga dinghuensis]|uniref:Non-ribosomal peptide synthase protein (TIGR01720 family)/amino acid adenylation domain-containing protein n=1 Tax=Chitinophaga dinghuensis TaxID=1539050 RepID=A0A327VQW4_9BACT|nr:non-ribosomal peptide synthetase [Chitinophaga dinghuensis]RAJ77625.1 non-ribosomal peptide synthase protein (TIGR01720 family)/amino acid adenylation domain-containing protein [Chitinophaga dinghuensis]
MDKKVIHSVFEKAAEKFPANTAVVSATENITYSELNAYANRLAHVLQLAGCTPEQIVNVVIPASVPQITALLAIFKTGGVYLPVDIAFAEKKLQQIFRDTFDGILVVTAAEKEFVCRRLQELEVDIQRLIVLHDDRRIDLYRCEKSVFLPVTFTEENDWQRNLPLIADGNSSNYIFYTSGSTGEGKAILGANAGLSHFIHWETKEFGFNETLRVSQLTAVTFDAALRDVFTALINGGTVYIPAAEIKNDPAALLAWLGENRIQLVHCVPSLFRVLTTELILNLEAAKQLQVKYLLMAGEMLYVKDVLNWRQVMGDRTQLVNLYGATETTLVKTFYRINEVSENPSQSIPAGKPISNTTVAIIRNGRVCQPGETGEIYIKTPFATKGYYNNEALTSACFVQNPLATVPDIVYKSGDQGRYLADGNIEVIGRLDNLVKVNGVRVELGEVERAMLGLENVTGCVVTVHRSVDNISTLTAYYTGASLEADVLRLQLSRYLNQQLIPTWFIHLDKFPLNTNGKIDRKALPAPVQEQLQGEAPEGELEMALADLWKAILGLEKVGRNVSFFSAGGHSLRAMQLLGRIHKAFGTAMKVQDIFLYPTIREQAAYIVRHKTGEKYNIRSVGEKASYSLSSSQKRIWVLSQFENSSVAYNMSGAYVFEGDLDVAALEYSLQQLVARHESLRTLFREDVDGIRQFILTADIAAFRMQFQDLRTAADAAHTADEQVRKSMAEPFQLSEDLPIRAELLQLEDNKWVFLFTMHHIICDYWSMMILVKELWTLYNSQVRGEASSLVPLKLQYRDYASWQEQQLEEGLLEQARKYWMQQLREEPPVLQLPTDYPRPAMKSYNGSIAARVLDNGVITRLQEMLQDKGATLFMGLLAAVNSLLYKYTAQEDMIVGSPVAGRYHADLQDQIGMYLNTLPLRTRFSAAESFNQLLDQVKSMTLAAYEHEAFPFELMLEELPLQRDMSRSTLFDVLIDLHDTRDLKNILPESGLTVNRYQGTAHVVSKFDLTFMFMVSESDVYLSLEYNTDLFSAATANRIIDHFEYLLAALTTDPSTPVCDLNYLSASEQDQLINGFNHSLEAGFPYASVVELFRAQAAQQPNAAALIYEGHTLSYEELDQASDRLAVYLSNSYEIKKEERIGILLDRSDKMLISILGVLKSGAAYVPLDPSYPVSRKEFIIQDAGINILLTQTDYIFDLSYYTGAVVAVDVQLDTLPLPASASTYTPSPDSLAYVIYTSGSTGMPKGCAIMHGNLSAYIQWANSHYFEGGRPHFGLFTSLSFDLTVTTIFCPLTSGGMLTIFPQHTSLSAILEASFDGSHGIDSIKLTPSHISMLRQLEIDTTSVRCAIVGGEQVLGTHVETLQGMNGNMSVYNEYGPTESTVGCIVASLSLNEPVIIGKPISGTGIYILDAGGRICGTGVTGEICITGAGLAAGYLNQPALTARQFTDNPFLAGYRLYKTGDLGYWQADGNLVYIGRRDEQVKIRGFRIEPGEVAHALQQHPSVQNAVVVAVTASGGEKELAAYLVADQELNAGELREFLSESLPAYMVPSHFVQLEEIPLTQNGKADKRRLPDPLGMEIESGATYVAASNEVEQQLIAVYEEVLKKKNIGIKDDFFVLGGDSIKSIQVVSRMKQRGYTLTIQDLLLHPVLEDTATFVLKNSRSISQDIITGKIPLSPIQYYFFSNNFKEKHHYNQSVLLQCQTTINEAALKAALEKILLHHDALRMVYRQTAGGWEQENKGATQGYALEILPYHTLDFDQHCNRIQAGINLETGPLVKTAIFRDAAGDRLLIVVHHLVMDGVSWRILLEDISALYEQALAGQILSLPMKTDAFQFWQEKQTAYASSETLQREAAYWSAIAAQPVPHLPLDYPGGTNLIKDISFRSFTLDQQLSTQLFTGCYSAYHTDTNDVLLTALSLALADVFETDRVLINLEGHGREQIGAEVDVTRTIGWFTSIYPVLFNMEYRADMIRQLIEVKEHLHRIPNKGIGYGILRYMTAAEVTTTPEVNFNYLGDFGHSVTASDGAALFRFSGEPHGRTISENWERTSLLDISGIVAEGRLRLTAGYNTAQFHAATIDRLMAAFEQHLGLLIRQLAATATIHLTPSDLTCKDLSVEAVMALTASGSVEDAYTLSPLQEGLYYQWLINPASSAYFEQMSYEVKGALDVALLEKSYNQLVARHGVLRTCFTQSYGDRPLQIVQRQAGNHFSCLDIRHQPEFSIQAFRDADRQQGFNLHEGSQMRLKVLRKDNDLYEFVWSHHHILMDGWCVSILIQEFFKIYYSLQQGISPALDKPVPYADYIEWLNGLNTSASLDYWQSYLSGYEEAAVLPSRNPTGNYVFKPEKQIFHIDGTLRKEVSNFCSGLGITESTFIQTVWGLLLGKYNSSNDVVFGAVVSGRPAELRGVEQMIGMFINTVPVRIQATADMQVKELFRKVQYASLESVPYHYTQLGQIQAGHHLGRELFNHIILFENYPVQQLIEQNMEKLEEDGVLSLVSCTGFGQNNFDLTITVLPGEDIMIKFEYNSHTYEPAMMAQLQEHFLQMTRSVISQEEALVNDLHYLSASEQDQLINGFNHSLEAGFPYASVVELFQAQAAQQPNAAALIYEGHTLSYEELDQASDKLAVYLSNTYEIKNDERIGILLDRSDKMLISILGVLKSGAAYVPLDPSYPVSRKEFIIQDAGINILLTQTDYIFDLSYYTGAVVAVDVQLDTLPLSASASTYTPSPDSLAYVIYTSGSTGMPKGCAITHGNLSAYIQWANSHYFEGGRPHFGLFTSLSFDLTVTTIFCPLTSRGMLTIFPQHTSLSAILAASFDGSHGIDSIKLTPSHINMLRQLEIDTTSVRCAIVGGEQVLGTHVETLQGMNGNMSVYNEYGPTESTVGCIVASLSLNEPVIIGKPISGTGIYILDAGGRICGTGVTGEICITGAGLAAGYLNQPALTARQFTDNPFLAGYRLYKTGDLGYWEADGNLVYIGRRDEQVKIRGFRIEPGEVAHALQQHPSVQNAAVVAVTASGGEKELAAYLVADQELNAGELREFLSESLPAYMVPSHFVQLEEIPLTQNGKADKRRLPDPLGMELRSGVEYVEPRNEIEEKLVAIWKDLLGKDKIGIRDNFFDAGGNSIKIVRLSHLSTKLLGKDISVALLFQYPNIEDLVDFIVDEPVLVAGEDDDFDRDELIGDLNKFNAYEDDLS